MTAWITRPNATGKTTDPLHYDRRTNPKRSTMPIAPPCYHLTFVSGRRLLRDDASPLTLDLGDGFGPSRWAVLPMPSLVTAAALVVGL